MQPDANDAQKSKFLIKNDAKVHHDKVKIKVILSADRQISTPHAMQTLARSAFKSYSVYSVNIQ